MAVCHKESANDAKLNTLIKGCQKGKYRSQRQLYKQFSPLLFAICMRYLKDKEWAADCLHDAFIKIYESINTYEFNGSFEGWLKKIQVNFCLMELRQQQKTMTNKYIEELPDQSEDIDEDFYESFDTSLIFESIKELPDGYRTIFNLYALDGYTHSEIATSLNISEGTSKSQYARARKLLKVNLGKIINERG